MPKFREWVENIANGQLVRICRPRGPIPALLLPTRLSSPTPQVGFFAELGEYLSESIAEQLAHPERYAHEQSVTRLAIWASRGRGMPNRTYGPAARQLWALRVLATTRLDTSPICSGMQVMRVYLEEGALENNDVDGVVGLLTMTLMAAVFNTQVSLAWILVHLYSQPELLAMARRELEGCSDLTDYSQLQKMEARARACCPMRASRYPLDAARTDLAPTVCQFVHRRERAPAHNAPGQHGAAQDRRRREPLGCPDPSRLADLAVP